MLDKTKTDVKETPLVRPLVRPLTSTTTPLTRPLTRPLTSTTTPTTRPPTTPLTRSLATTTAATRPQSVLKKPEARTDTAKSLPLLASRVRTGKVVTPSGAHEYDRKDFGKY